MGLDRLVDDLPEEACISIAALKRIKAAGVHSRIVGVEFDGEPFEALNSTKWPVKADGSVIGKSTSAIYSPRLGRNIGYAWVPTQHAGQGTSLEVDTEWGTRNAVVVEMPFVDPSKQIPIS
jgi:aminomethyltransferase